MKTYKLKLTALSPIHIGTGEDYEPINYVIDNLTKTFSILNNIIRKGFD